MQPDSISQALQGAVSPVILISAYGLLLLSMTNRLGRAIDRARALAHSPNPVAVDQVSIIMRRARWIRSAILFASIAITAAAMLVLVLFVSVFIRTDLNGLVSGLFLLSLISLIVSLAYFIVDIFTSLRALETDVAAARR